MRVAHPARVAEEVVDSEVRQCTHPDRKRLFVGVEQGRVEARLLSVEVGGESVRYIRVVAANRAILPDWHVGAGDTGWIFVDEIVVEGA